jgi:hypothetical protein
MIARKCDTHWICTCMYTIREGGPVWRAYLELHVVLLLLVAGTDGLDDHVHQDRLQSHTEGIGFTYTEDIGVSLQTYIFTCTGRSVAAFDLSTMCEGWNVFNILYNRDDAPPPRPRPHPRRRCSTAAPTTRKWPPCSCHAGTWRVVSEKIGSMRRESRGKVDKA